MKAKYSEQEYISVMRALAWANDWSCVDAYADGDLLELLSECEYKMPIIVKSLKVLNDSHNLAKGV